MDSEMFNRFKKDTGTSDFDGDVSLQYIEWLEDEVKGTIQQLEFANTVIKILDR